MTKAVFNWHEEPEKSMYKYLMITALPAGYSKEFFEELSVATNKFNNVELIVSVNGIELDAEQFFKALDQAFDWAVDEKVQSRAEEVLNFDALEEAIADAAQDLKTHLRKRYRALGIKVRSDD